jgi:plasmid maintenance system antidote protein VapI
MKNKNLIENFKKFHEIEVNANVAYVLQQEQTTVTAWAAERRPIPTNVKFRLLQHVDFSPEIEKIAAEFVDIGEHRVLLEEEKDRIAAIKNKDVYRVINTKDIDRLRQFQDELKLTDEQTAKFLEVDLKEFHNIKNGVDAMPTMTRMWFSFLRNAIKGFDWSYKKLLPEEINEKFKAWEIEYRKSNLQKRIDKRRKD